VVEIVALDKTYDVSDARSIEGLASQARFFGKYLECGEALTADSAGLGEPQRGVAGARPNLDHRPGRYRCGPQGDEASVSGVICRRRSRCGVPSSRSSLVTRFEFVHHLEHVSAQVVEH